MIRKNSTTTAAKMITGSGMSKIGRDVPSVSKPSSGSVCPSAMTLARPLKTASVPSVVIRALMPTTLTRKPLIDADADAGDRRWR